jgi:hypothetical protein
MKKILYIAATALLLGACAKPAPTNEEKAQKLINEFIMANANDPSSYEPISFGTLDSTFASFYASEKYKDLYALRMRYDSLVDKYLMDFNAELYSEYHDKREEVDDIITQEAAAYTGGEHLGFKMSHRYRAANGFGAITLGTTIFYFDKELTDITRTKNEE